jgi:hypothetical protein
VTLSDGPYVGVVDRFENEQAVVVLERDGTEVGDVLVPKSRLPQRARRQNAIVRVVLKNGDVVNVWYDAQATRDRGASAQARFDRIAEPAPEKRDESEENGMRDESEENGMRDKSDHEKADSSPSCGGEDGRQDEDDESVDGSGE